MYAILDSNNINNYYSTTMNTQKNPDVDSLQDKMNALLSKYGREYVSYFKNTIRPIVMGSALEDYNGQVIEILVCDIKCPRDAKFIDSKGKCRCVDASKMRDCTCDDVSNPNFGGGCGGCATGCKPSTCTFKSGRRGTRNDCRCNEWQALMGGIKCGCPAPGTSFYDVECKLPPNWDNCRQPRLVRYYIDEKYVLHKITGQCTKTPVKVKGTLSHFITNTKYTLGTPLSKDASCDKTIETKYYVTNQVVLRKPSPACTKRPIIMDIPLSEFLKTNNFTLGTPMTDNETCNI